MFSKKQVLLITHTARYTRENVIHIVKVERARIICSSTQLLNRHGGLPLHPHYSAEISYEQPDHPSVCFASDSSTSSLPSCTSHISCILLRNIEIKISKSRYERLRKVLRYKHQVSSTSNPALLATLISPWLRK